MKLEQKVAKDIVQFHMLTPGDRVIAGVSGGADSVCLLLVLKRLEERFKTEIRAVHIHHGLRAAADADEEFVRRLCRSLDVPLHVYHADVWSEAAKRGRSIEETGRDIRCESFCREAKLWEQQQEGRAYPKIAVAHHQEDCAETVLMNLCRGTSLAGLSGIRPVSTKENVTFIRPLIDCTREEIEEYLRGTGQSWCTDETNAEDVYTRNYVRGHILPELNDNVNPGTTRHLCRTARDLQEAENFLQNLTDRTRVSCRIQDDAPVYSAADLQRVEPYLQRRVLYAILAEAMGGLRDISFAHVEELQKLLAANGSCSICLPGGLTACREYDRLRVVQKEAGTELRWTELERCCPQNKEDYSVRVFPYNGRAEDIPKGPYTKWFDYDKMAELLSFRTRQTGDRITLEPEKSKKLTRIMIDMQIPAPMRSRIVLPADGSQILWIPGGRVNYNYLVESTTQNILELTVRCCGQTTGRRE